jgi:hypothetical protein
MTRKEFLYNRIKWMLDVDFYEIVDSYASATMNYDEYEAFCAETEVEDAENEKMEQAMNALLEKISEAS